MTVLMATSYGLGSQPPEYFQLLSCVHKGEWLQKDVRSNQVTSVFPEGI